VDAVDAGVTDLTPGAPVLAVTRFGGYAEQLVVPRHQVHALPAGLTMEQAAAFPAVHLTAWYALCDLVRLRPGLQVLVHSGAGGVGGALLQILKLHGCPGVAVVGGPHKRATALALGARAVIDKSREPLWPAAERLSPPGYDVILDANGAATLRQSYRHLAPAGRLVVYGFHTMLPRTGGRPSWIKLALTYLATPWFSPLALCNENRSLLAFNLSYLFEHRALLSEGMAQLLAWLGEGRLQPPPVQTFPLERVADAHRALESGQTVGKLVLVT
jgi:NADPH:quinone reductase-like Zn-dependent oxidoreductase